MRLSPLCVTAAVCAVPTSSLLAQNCDGWVPIGDPVGRVGHSLTYDSDRGVMVMFGGRPAVFQQAALGASAETWEYGVQGWRFRTLAGPAARIGAALAYDSDRHVAVLFGGQIYNYGTGSGTLLADTWEWNGQSWTERTPQHSPLARVGAALGYDPQRSLMLLSGGVSRNDTWRWTGDDWVQMNPATVPVGNEGRMVFDPSRGMLVLQQLGSTWAWDGGNWLSLVTSAPQSLSIAFDPSRSQLIGTQRGALTFTYRLTGSTWTPIAEIPRVEVFGGELVHHEALGSHMLVCSSSQASPSANSTTGFELPDGALAWTPRLRRADPPAPEDSAMAFDPGRGVSVLSGGFNMNHGYNNQTWELRGETWRLRDSTLPPHASGGMAFDHQRNVIVRTAPTLGTSEWDGQSWTPTSTTGLSSEIVWAPNAGAVLAWGLSAALYTGSGWSALSPSVSLSNNGLAFDTARDGAVAVGAQSNGATYFWDAISFAPLINTIQTGYWGAAALYDPSRGGVLCFGGFSSAGQGTFPRATYFLASNASAWEDLGLRGPNGRKWPTMTYDPLSERTLLYGGTDHAMQYRETWKLARGETAIARQPQATTAFDGGTAELFVIAKGGGWLDYQWRKNGVPLEDDARINGAWRDTLVISTVEAGDAGSYDCVVSGPCGQATSAAAVLTVNCYANCDGSTATPVLNVADFTCFLQQFAAGNNYANCDQSTAPPTLNVADFTCFLQRFAAGCP